VVLLLSCSCFFSVPCARAAVYCYGGFLRLARSACALVPQPRCTVRFFSFILPRVAVVEVSRECAPSLLFRWQRAMPTRCGLDAVHWARCLGVPTFPVSCFFFVTPPGFFSCVLFPVILFLRSLGLAFPTPALFSLRPLYFFFFFFCVAARGLLVSPCPLPVLAAGPVMLVSSFDPLIPYPLRNSPTSQQCVDSCHPQGSGPCAI